MFLNKYVCYLISKTDRVRATGEMDSMESAIAAKRLLEKQYPDQAIEIVCEEVWLD